MPKPARGRSKTKAFSGKVVPVNPWIPAVPVKGTRLLKLVLGVPLVLMAGTAAAEPLPARALMVPVELSRQFLSRQAFDLAITSQKIQILQKFESKNILLAARGKGGRKG